MKKCTLVCFQDGDVQEFRATLRMPPEVYDNLFKLLKKGLTRKHTNMRKPICPEARLALTMRYLALGDGFLSLSQQFRIGLSTCRLIVRQTCRLIYRTMKARYMCTPKTCAEWTTIAEEFNKKWQFPHLLGLVDGKHIRIDKPPKTGSTFFNYKGYFSIVLMGICDADYKFIYIDVGSEGKASDGGIWNRSSFAEHLFHPANPLDIPQPKPLNNVSTPFYLVGDSAFKLLPNMMKPYPTYNTTNKQKVFNYRLCRVRRIIENCFGIMACRFRILRRCIEVHPSFAEDIVLACCILHNYLREYSGNNYMPARALDQEMVNGDIVPGQWREEVRLHELQRDRQTNPSQYAKEIRNHLADYFLTAEGEVPWQYDRAGI